MVECQVLGMFAFAAVLAAIAITNIDPGTFHGRFSIVSTNMDVVSQPHDGRDRERCRRRVQNIVAVIFFDKNSAAKPQTNSPCNTDGAERLI